MKLLGSRVRIKKKKNVANREEEKKWKWVTTRCHQSSVSYFFSGWYEQSVCVCVLVKWNNQWKMTCLLAIMTSDWRLTSVSEWTILVGILPLLLCCSCGLLMTAAKWRWRYRYFLNSHFWSLSYNKNNIHAKVEATLAIADEIFIKNIH